MDYFDTDLHIRDVNLSRLLETAGTPTYVYFWESIEEQFTLYRRALQGYPNDVCYAVKANSAGAILKGLANAGACFDVVSAGEIFRVISAGGRPETIVFSGVGKTKEDLRYAISCGVRRFNCENIEEIDHLDAVSREVGTIPEVNIRLNPGVLAQTHGHITTGGLTHKFGLPYDGVVQAAGRAQMLGLTINGIAFHLGSQIMNPAPIFEALSKTIELIQVLRLKGHPIKEIDIGGGLGVALRPEERAPDIAAFCDEVKRLLNGTGLKLTLEPGRSIVADSGILLTRVLYKKQMGEKMFVIVDGAMNDLIRPALYDAYHPIIPAKQHQDRGTITCDVVGPVCETADYFARNRNMQDVAAGDFLVVGGDGGYGYSMASNYNSRPRAMEVLVENGVWRVIRRRETFQDLIRGEI